MEHPRKQVPDSPLFITLYSGRTLTRSQGMLESNVVHGRRCELSCFCISQRSLVKLSRILAVISSIWVFVSWQPSPSRWSGARRRSFAKGMGVWCRQPVRAEGDHHRSHHRSQGRVALDPLLGCLMLGAYGVPVEICGEINHGDGFHRWCGLCTDCE